MKKHKKNINNKPIRLIFLGIVLILLVAILSYVLSTNPKKQIIIDNTSNTTNSKITGVSDKIDTTNNKIKKFDYLSIKTTNSDIADILTKSAQILENSGNKNKINGQINFSEKSGEGLSWSDAENYGIYIDKTPNIRFDINDNNDLEKIKSFYSNVLTSIENLFITNNYQKNLNNSSYFDADYYSYEKGNIKCSLSIQRIENYNISLSNWGIIFLTCSDKYQENYQQQINILKDLGIKNEFLILNKSNISGRYAFFSFDHTTRIAMMDANDKWNVLFKGLDPPPCDIVINNKVPNNIAPICYPKGEYTNTISNPIK